MKRLLALATLLVVSLSAFADDTDTVNFRFNPIGLLFGSLGAGVDFKIADDWTVGPQFLFWHYDLTSNATFTSNFDVLAWGVGARANWFYNGAYKSGLYVGPSLTYVSIKVSSNDANGSVTGSVSPLLLGCLVGYGWFWDSFNIMLGGGATVGLGDTTVTLRDSAGNRYSTSTDIAGLDFEFSLGWTL